MRWILNSKSKRTTVSIDLENADGSGLITVERDGRTMHRFDIPPEQQPVDGTPKSEL